MIREFLKMINENSRKIAKHYELPLPLRNPATKLPNNRYLPEKRLLSLKKRFLKHPDFFSDYTRFVEKLIDKGYPSKSNKVAPEGIVYPTSLGIPPQQSWEGKSS